MNTTTETTPTTPKRPNKSDVLHGIAKKLAPQVMQWLKEDGSDDAELADIERDILKAIRWDLDGYAIAKDLDYYSPDAALVEILNQAGGISRNLVTEAEMAWVIKHNVQPIPIGTKVRWPRSPEKGIGIVTANHPDGKSSVNFDGLELPEAAKKGGYLIEWENLQIVL